MKLSQGKLLSIFHFKSKGFSPNSIAQTIKTICPTKIIFWSVMSAQGTGHLYAVESTMNLFYYKKVLKQRLIPQLKDGFLKGDFIFIHNKTPCRKALSVAKCFDEKRIKTLPWPGSSSDMNLIENLLAIVKRK